MILRRVRIGTSGPVRITLTSAPADTGWCRRPTPGRTLGYLVSRMVRAGSDQVVPVDPPVVVVDGVDAAEVDWAFPWAVGDLVETRPLMDAPVRCGTCWSCRGRGLVEAVRAATSR